MQQLRSDLWASGFLRRHNAIGALCVVGRRGDPLAGQIWIEVDHLDATRSLLVPAPSAMVGGVTADRVFMWRYRRVEPAKVSERIAREAAFDPDFWVLVLETREGPIDIDIVDADT